MTPFRTSLATESRVRVVAALVLAFTLFPAGTVAAQEPPVATGRQHQVEVARASAEDARPQVRAEELRLRREETSSLLGLGAAYRSALLQQRVRERSEVELRLATERFRFGTGTSVEITDTQTNLAQAEIDRIESIFTFHQSLTALEALVGERLR
jgi:outer membrane protein TolC